MRFISAFFILLLILSFAAATVQAQEEVDIEYGENASFEFDEDNNEVVFIFEGEAGDVISAVAAFEYSEDFDYSATLTMELTNEDDDTVAEGQNIDFLFATPGLIAELEEDGEYRLVVEFDGTGEATMQLRLDETAYLSDESVTFGISSEGLPTLVGISVEDDGLYQISLTPEDGDMNFTFYLLEFSSSFPTTLASISGEGLEGWSIVVDLEDGEDYIATMGSLFSLLFSDSQSIDSEVSLTMVPFED
jgi:hypothetical protein